MRIDRIRAHYEPRVHPGRESYDILDWSSAATQQLRFRVLLDVLRGERSRQGRSVGPGSGRPRLLDVGCGLTDLCTFLAANGEDVSYSGVDVSPAVLREARRRWPGRALLEGDVFGAAPFPGKTFDVAFCSGIFNLRLDNNREFARRALPRLLGLVGGCVVANFLHVRTRWKHPHCFYFDPDDVCEPVRGAASGIDVIDDYLDNDFTVVVRP